MRVVARDPGLGRRARPAEHRLYPAGAAGPEAAALEAWLDGGLGPDGRLWMYEQTLPVVQGLAPWALHGVPAWERRAFRVGRHVIDPAIRHFLGVDAAAAAAALERVDRVFDDVGARLADGRRFLLGDRFTAADLAFAALAAPVLLPAAYGSPLPPPEAVPDAMAREVRRLRAHPAGLFAGRLYDEQRRGPAAGHDAV